jgi:hypothetical protein
MERCPIELCDSENLQEDEIKENQALREKQGKVEAARMM